MGGCTPVSRGTAPGSRPAGECGRALAPPHPADGDGQGRRARGNGKGGPAGRGACRFHPRAGGGHGPRPPAAGHREIANGVCCSGVDHPVLGEARSVPRRARQCRACLVQACGHEGERRRIVPFGAASAAAEGRRIVAPGKADRRALRPGGRVPDDPTSRGRQEQTRKQRCRRTSMTMMHRAIHRKRRDQAGQGPGKKARALPWTRWGRHAKRAAHDGPKPRFVRRWSQLEGRPLTNRGLGPAAPVGSRGEAPGLLPGASAVSGRARSSRIRSVC